MMVMRNGWRAAIEVFGDYSEFDWNLINLMEDLVVIVFTLSSSLCIVFGLLLITYVILLCDNVFSN